MYQHRHIATIKKLVARSIFPGYPSGTSRRRFLAGAGLLLAGGTFSSTFALLRPDHAKAQELSYFRIGAGAPGTQIYELAGLIGGAISNPPGSRSCDEGGSCGIPGMIGTAQTSSGSIDNLSQLRGGAVESAVVQADIAYLAYGGKDIFKAVGSDTGMRAIAGLGRLNAKIIVMSGSPVKNVAGLKGRRVNIGPEKSDSAITARQLLSFHGISLKRLKPSYLEFPAAAEALKAGKIDALVVIDAVDSRDVTGLASATPIRLLPIEGAPVEKMRGAFSFISAGSISDSAFKGVPATPTIELVAVWLVSATLENDVAYELTRAVWREAGRKALDLTSAAGKALDLKLAITGVSVPFHPGALRYYDEQGVTRFLPDSLKPEGTVKTN